MRVTVKKRRRLKYQGTVYEAGDSVDLPARVAEMWINKGRVVEAKAISGSKNKAVTSAETLNKTDLSSKSKAELYEMAQVQDIEGRSSMDRDELIKALEN